MIFKHSKYFFAKDNVRFRVVDRRKSMEVAVRVEGTISNKAVNRRMPC